MAMDWRNLNLREKIGQTVVLMGNPEEEKARYGSLEAFLAQYPVGGLFLGSEIIKAVRDDKETVLRAKQQYNSASKVPMLFASDMENGCGNMIRGLTSFPHQMALGATGSATLAYEYGKATALESRTAGINWSFSPVADLNLNALNPITNIRAVSDNPDLTMRLLKQVVSGMQDYGIAATAKHFPGDGTDYRDQHLVTTINSLPYEQWQTHHGKVFQALIDHGVYSIMIGHISLPSYPKQTVDGKYLPATLSRELIEQLLRREMGFKGVVLSDALVMGGFLKWFERERAEIECFKAGTDVMLWPTPTYIDRMEAAIAAGEVPMERLDDAVSRVWEMKRKLGLFADHDAPFVLTEDQALGIAAVAQEVADRSITVLRNEGGLLPVRKETVKKVLIVGVVAHDPVFEEMGVMKAELESRGMEAELCRNIGLEQLEQAYGQYDLIIYALSACPHQPKGPLNFYDKEAETIWNSLTYGADKSIVISFGSPYFYKDYYERAPVYLNAYSNVACSFRAAVRAIWGEISITGQSPIHGCGHSKFEVPGILWRSRGSLDWLR